MAETGPTATAGKAFVLRSHCPECGHPVSARTPEAVAVAIAEHVVWHYVRAGGRV